ncbi:hypothetical protein C1N91_01895 [Curtobacterium sp. SGAir0471]|uniref:hypothetical protein n=1 Tax=Curtobacterium sp. SGAir0471 TaxID=2070337 RepID=UPI0010CCB815|nr:hypothetical protein [Curtobacterium sp. SGAir0471]QCR42483.1 hypothetical protein C1N91_01895 [Curtobacterium sp. SGAir0471]
MLASPADIDHRPDDGFPVFRTSTAERRRTAVLTAGTLVLAVGVVLAVAEVLPVLDGWVLPTALVALTAVFLASGRRSAAVGSTNTAHAWAGWAGLTAGLAVAGLVDLAGYGGALVAVLLVVLVVEAAIALWFRSPVHLVVVQALAVVWGVVAHVFGTVPWAVLVAGLAGAWWVRHVGPSRSVVVGTTIVVPVAVALVVHPFTHTGAAVDTADVAVLTGAVAAAATAAAVVGRSRPVSTVWSTTRRTVTVVLVLQVLTGAVPAVAVALAPSSSAWPSLLLATATLAVCAAVVALRATRSGVVTVLLLTVLQLAEVAAATVSGTAAATSVGLGGLLALAVVTLVRCGRASSWLGVLVVPPLWAALLGVPTWGTAVVWCATGAVVVLTLASGRGVRR